MEEKEAKTFDRKKLWLTVIVSVLFAGVLIAVVLTFLLFYNSEVPNKVEQRDNTYFYVEANNNYKGYRFKFESEDQTLTFDNQSNIIYVKDMDGLIAGSKYQVSACYISEKENASSEYSEPITWTCYLRLETPMLFIEDDIITWQEIDNASYYNVQIISSNDTTLMQTQSASFDLNNISGGQYEIFVSAVSDNEYYLESNLAESLNVDFSKYFQPFTSATVNLENKILTITGEQEISKIDIKIGLVTYKDFVVKPTLEDGKYIYNISLRDFEIDNETFVGARPSNIDQYNIYNGEFTQAIIQ